MSQPQRNAEARRYWKPRRAQRGLTSFGRNQNYLSRQGAKAAKKSRTREHFYLGALCVFVRDKSPAWKCSSRSPREPASTSASSPPLKNQDRDGRRLPPEE
jgi:hypothetical protein